MRFLCRGVIYIGLVLVLSSEFCLAQSIYGVSIDTTKVKGTSGKLIFDITSNFPLTNRVDVINFSTDGTIGMPQTQGGVVSGDLIQHLNPAKFTRLKANSFFNELSLPFIAFGDQVNFTINVSETGPHDGNPPDEFSVSLLDKNGRSLGTTSQDWKPDLAVTITGERGGALDVSWQGRRPRTPGRMPDVISNRGLNIGLRNPAVIFTVTPAWTPDDPALYQNAKILEGTLTEFCNRRCANLETICTGGAFGLVADDNTFYPFDDLGNLRAQVALVDIGQNPLKEGQFGRAKVVGIVKNSILTVREISVF